MIKSCLNCGQQFEIPPCREWREKCCSSECKKEYRNKNLEESRKERTRFCAVCGNEFVARQTQIDVGHGIYCSCECRAKGNTGAKRTAETKQRISDGQYMAMANGKLVHKSGIDHPRWKGGEKATIRRRIESGKARASVNRYRANNPETVREWVRKRKALKIGRLPRGTVKSLLFMQKGKCAICSCFLGGKYHLDHIKPLARGGEHTRLNVQLLCPSCNVKKWAKDPIDYMQEIGRLL